MYNEKLPINRFSGNFSSYMHTILFLSMNFVYKACNPAILNLSIVKEKISLGLLDYRPKLLTLTVSELFICMCIFFVTSTGFLVIVCFLFSWMGSWVYTLRAHARVYTR